MAKEFKVFFSWQSDLPANQTTRFIEESIELAKELLPTDIILVPDEATRNRLGSPDITNSIFEKICDCDLFIADVSIVGSYALPRKEDDDEEDEVKYIPNPNVLLELGFAASQISWDRCICLANTKFGAIGQMPFDLNHRRITDYNYEKSSRKQKIFEIAEIIKSTIIAFVDKPMAKNGFSHHIIGGFDIASEQFTDRLIPYNDFTLENYRNKTQELIEEAKDIINRALLIQIPDKSVETEDDFDLLTENMTVSDILKDPVLSKKFSLKMSNPRDIKINTELISGRAKKFLGIEISDEFYKLGNLKETTPIFSNNSITLDGTDEEKEKYGLIQDLRNLLLNIELRDMFEKLFEDIIIIPLAIKNLSTKNDERISISIKVICGKPVQPTRKFFNQEYAGLEGHVYDEHLVEEMLSLPENSIINFDSSMPARGYDMPTFNPLDAIYPRASDDEDYEGELQDYIQDVDDGSTDEYSFTISALRPNETLWLDRVLLIQPTDNQIAIKYSIKSNNSTGHIEGTLFYNKDM